MALVKCNECEKMISDSSKKCIECGAPINTESRKKKSNWVAYPIDNIVNGGASRKQKLQYTNHRR